MQDVYCPVLLQVEERRIWDWGKAGHRHCDLLQVRSSTLALLFCCRLRRGVSPLGTIAGRRADSHPGTVPQYTKNKTLKKYYWVNMRS